MALRSRIFLLCADGMTKSEVANKLGISLPAVGKWRSRFACEHLDSLADAPRPGQPRTIDDAKIEEVVTLTLETKPTNATQWSTRSRAKACGLTQSAVLRIWRAFGLKPPLGGNLQTFHRSVLCGEGARYRRLVSESSGRDTGLGAVCGRTGEKRR